MFKMQSVIFCESNGQPISETDFQEKYLIPFCGEANVMLVFSNIKFLIFAICESPIARKSIAKEVEDGKYAVEYNDYNVVIKFLCFICNGTCRATMMQ